MVKGRAEKDTGGGRSLILQNVLDVLDLKHAQRVSELSQALAKEAGLNERETLLVSKGAMYHDIGKIAIPKSILEANRGLTDAERRTVEKHVEYGLSILAAYTGQEMSVAKTIIATHHEHWDGSGYPQGLKGEQIPLCGRIVAICDVFDALISVRPYKRVWPVGEAIQYLADRSGTQFDPLLTDKFIRNVAVQLGKAGVKV